MLQYPLQNNVDISTAHAHIPNKHLRGGLAHLIENIYNILRETSTHRRYFGKINLFCSYPMKVFQYTTANIVTWFLKVTNYLR